MKVHDWHEWQSYRSDRRQPPWIKLHRRLLRDMKWVSLTDGEKGQLVSIWMLAADSDGYVPDDPVVVQRLCGLESPPDFKKLISLHFLDAKTTPRRRQRGAKLTPISPARGKDTDTDKTQTRPPLTPPRGNGAGAPFAPPEWIPREAWDGWVEMRRKKRNAPTTKAQSLAVKELEKLRREGYDPGEVLDNCTLRGWVGIFPPKGDGGARKRSLEEQVRELRGGQP